MTETNSHQTEHHETETDPSQSPPTNRDASEQSESESRKPWHSLSVTAWLAIAGGLGTALGAGLTSAGEVLTSYLEFNSQFTQRRQEFEFELIREALEVQPTPPIADQEEVMDESDVTDEVVSFAQDTSPDDEDIDQDDPNQDDEDRQRAAKELEFYADIGIIQSLDVEKVRVWATERVPELPKLLPRLQSPNRASPYSFEPYCFNIEESVNAYSQPSFDSEVLGALGVGDVVYATRNPIESYWFRDGTADGNSFVKVALYDGVIGWIPRFQKGADSPVIVDLPDCPNPGPNAAGFPGGIADERVCYYVLEATNLYGRPEFTTPLDASFAQNDIAYASYPFQKVIVQNGKNAFVLIDIFDGNQAWVPLFSADLSTKHLEQFPPEDCARP